MVLSRDREPGAFRLFLGDMILAVGFQNEVRRRVVARLFGADADMSPILTVILAGVLADTLHGVAGRAFGAFRFRARPSVGDALVGAVVVKEVLHGFAGVRTRDLPVVGAIVMAAAAEKSVRRVTAGTRGMGTVVARRYRHQRRERRSIPQAANPGK
jgi:hypothetical protein